MKQNNGHWRFAPRDLDPEKAVGFVYLIVDKKDKSKYIGKKQFRGRGKLNKGVGSNWRSYTSSSKELNARIQERGKDDFIFIIIEQYYTIGGWSFAETWSQVVCETPSNNAEYLNRFIDKVTWKVTEPVTARHKKRLKFWINKLKFSSRSSQGPIPTTSI
jgi:hypothetical protein